MTKNNQKPELISNAKELAVNSIFPTIQGEGPFSGEFAIFIRLAGCNLACPKCDTEYTKRQMMTTREIISNVLDYSKGFNTLVVITGGEPFRQNIKQLILNLNSIGFRVQIESNGTIAPPSGIIWNTVPHIRNGSFLVVSPKTGKIHDSISNLALAFKYPINKNYINPKDGLPTRILGVHVAPARPNEKFKGEIYITPEDGNDLITSTAANMREVAKIAMEFGYIAQVQLHKILDIK